jgi:hypothetical protein
MRGVTVLGLVLAVVGGAVAGPAARVERQGVELVLSVDKEQYAAGEPVQMELVVRNPGPGTAAFQFSDSQRYDFLVLREDGRLVWRWSHDKMFAQVLGTLTLAPGEERRFRERWDQRDEQGRPVPAGRYWVEGLFPPQRPVLPIPVGLRGPRVEIHIVAQRGEAPSSYRKVFRAGRLRVRFFAWVSERDIQRLLHSLDLRVEREDPAGFVVVRTRDRDLDEVWEVAQALNRSALVEWAVPDYVLVRRW